LKAFIPLQVLGYDTKTIVKHELKKDDDLEYIKNPHILFTSNAKSFSRAVLTSHRLGSFDKNQGEIRKKAILCEEISPDLSCATHVILKGKVEKITHPS